MHQAFTIKDIGSVKYYVEIARSNVGMLLSQHKYIINLLDDVGMTNCKPTLTPLPAGCKLSMEHDTEMTCIGELLADYFTLDSQGLKLHMPHKY